MHELNRRRFIRFGAAALTAAAAAPLSGAARAAGKKNRKMTIDLCCGRIGVKASQADAIVHAQKHGFESVEPNGKFLAAAAPAEIEEILADLKARDLVWGAASLPVDFRKDEDTFKSGLDKLKEIAPALQRAGVTRIGTWLTPASNELDFAANLALHARRLREAAKILGAGGLRFGLEYVGPKTSRVKKRYPFVHNMAQTKELIAEIGCDNVGLALDSWHWYTAHETRADLETLSNDDIVAVDLNDAPAGLEIDEQIDNQRELPMATGVIDVGAFLNALNAIGCDAPVRAEPFNAALRAMPPEEALAATAAAMKKAFALIT